MAKAIIGAAFCALVANAAFAQANPPLGGAAVVSQITPAEMMEGLTSLGFQPSVTGMAQDAVQIQAAAEGGAFYVVLRECQPGGGDVVCTTVQPFAVFEGADPGVFNEFNMGVSAIAVAGSIGANTIVGAKIYLNLGTSYENFGFQFGLFLRDVGTFAERYGGGATSVSYAPAPDMNAASQGFIAPDGLVLVNSGAAADGFLKGARALGAPEAKIDN